MCSCASYDAGRANCLVACLQLGERIKEQTKGLKLIRHSDVE